MSHGLPTYSNRHKEPSYDHERKEFYTDGPQSLEQPLTPLRSTREERLFKQPDEYPKTNEAPTPSPKDRNLLMSSYLSLSRMLGFRETLSLILMFIFGGALIGYCLAKSVFMDSKKRIELTTAGELFWLNRAPYKATYIIHIFLSILGGIFVGTQFIPAVRRVSMFFHRINGYFCVFAVVVSNIAGTVVARRSFGGELNVQAAYWTLAIMSTFALTLGLWYAKRDTRKHRRWMLKGVVYFAAVITGRLTMMAANVIITLSGEYYVPWRCDALLSVLNDTRQLSRLYPECQMSGDTLVNPIRSVTVHCSVQEGSLGKASCERATHGMGLWIAMLIHVVGVEIYLRCTERANYQRIGYVLQPRDSVQPESPPALYNESALPSKAN